MKQKLNDKLNNYDVTINLGRCGSWLSQKSLLTHLPEMVRYIAKSDPARIRRSASIIRIGRAK